MSSRFRNNPQGFTLLEILISMGLLSVISYAIYQATTSTYRLHDELLHEGDFHNGIRLAMSIVERDISLMYSPGSISPGKSERAAVDDGSPASAAQAAEIARQEQADAEELTRGGLNRSSEFWGGMVDKTGIRPSRFNGTDKKISFVSASGIRVYKETRACELSKITYELKADRNDREKGTQVLMRTEDTNAFDEDDRRQGDKTQYRKTFPVLYGVKKFKFEYYWKKKDRWMSSWDTDSSDFKNIYPDAIRAELEIIGTGKVQLLFEGVHYFRPEFPLSQGKKGLNASF